MESLESPVPRTIQPTKHGYMAWTAAAQEEYAHLESRTSYEKMGYSSPIVAAQQLAAEHAGANLMSGYGYLGARCITHDPLGSSCTYTYSRSTVNSTIIIRHSSCAQHAFCVHWHGVFGDMQDMYACTRVMHLAVCSTHVCNVHACTCQMNHDVHALYTYVYIHTSPYTQLHACQHTGSRTCLCVATHMSVCREVKLRPVPLHGRAAGHADSRARFFSSEKSIQPRLN